jgi:hypothetical protein
MGILEAMRHRAARGSQHTRGRNAQSTATCNSDREGGRRRIEDLSRELACSISVISFAISSNLITKLDARSLFFWLVLICPERITAG